VLLADAGLAALDIPENDARPVDIPASLREAPAEEVSSEPFLLNFLAELAVRRGDFTKAAGLREQAVAASGDRDAAFRLALAAALRRQVLSEPGGSGSDLRRALSYAQAAVEERRRWDGPSADALAEVLDILITAGNMAAAVTAALPASEADASWSSQTRCAPWTASRTSAGSLARTGKPSKLMPTSSPDPAHAAQ
jgi:hypothetical protein